MAEVAALRKDRQIKYFLRCLKTFLPHQYTSNDSSRMTLAFFSLAGLDLLDALDDNLSLAERKGYIYWIYHCQVPSGGFRGFPGTIFGDSKRTDENECWDPANVPATFFALMALIVLGDDLTRVKRRECLLWLRNIQREDGSFGEILGPGGQIEGSNDLRFCCCAAGVRYILRGKDADYLKDIEDINTNRLISHIEDCQSYDGGFSVSPMTESHAGLTYCALASLSFLGCTPPAVSHSIPFLSVKTAKFEDLIRWLAWRQTADLEEVDEGESGSEKHITPGVDRSIDEQISALPDILSPPQRPSEHLHLAGFNGRSNKIADTCYSFWVTGTLGILDSLNVINAEAGRRYLLEKTQHIIGGFGKCVGDPPDLLHSYLALASLGLLGEAGIASVDPTFCTSKRARQHLESLTWWTGVESKK
ncbi:protein farnesyltransferase/geranylgeranyltransferase type-1 subunit alpha [Blastomyces dermatitidis ER-3]|uniref:Protein farnesyltransferase/geranylgeranyltransferase type-1 subunit alpha n=1 Tax=Ajellomyces dermatitidis (strain ER-3 / ATCC MYA-2586) TaxID=559297 RepID=A0ABP2EX31_AJEDR|nr:protein farnesyltransferase/geranylgeranyltransferase type-1 subunit alpha [Blastomyces dermatitidis ER-3]EEQ88660.1 protein farnesyltransferase/geranylgeranyltransferase type-1 subunit alpha [Blastomyces dermatitidis ER-3]